MKCSLRFWICLTIVSLINSAFFSKPKVVKSEDTSSVKVVAADGDKSPLKSADKKQALLPWVFPAGAMFLRFVSWQLTRKWFLMSVKPAYLPTQSFVIHRSCPLFLQFPRSKKSAASVPPSDDSPIKRTSKKRSIRIDSDEESNDSENKYKILLLMKVFNLLLVSTFYFLQEAKMRN